MEAMGVRLLALAIALFVGGALWFAWDLWRQERMKALQEADLPGGMGSLLEGGRPAVLYFTSASCSQCRMRQAPVLERLRAELDVAVLEIDAVEEHEWARHFGVMTVPSTVLFDGGRRLAAINHGLASLSTLRQQISR